MLALNRYPPTAEEFEVLPLMTSSIRVMDPGAEAADEGLGPVEMKPETSRPYVSDPAVVGGEKMRRPCSCMFDRGS